MYASSCLLLWWLYDDDAIWCMLSHLQKYLNFYLNFSDAKIMSAFEVFLHGSPYYDKIIIYNFIRLSALNPSTCFITGNLVW